MKQIQYTVPKAYADEFHNYEENHKQELHENNPLLIASDGKTVSIIQNNEDDTIPERYLLGVTIIKAFHCGMEYAKKQMHLDTETGDW